MIDSRGRPSRASALKIPTLGPLASGTLAALWALSWGCASALKEPRPLSDLGGVAPGTALPADPSEIAALSSQAKALFAERDPAKATTAARLLLRVAAVEGAPRDALIEAVRVLIWLTDHAFAPEEREQAATSAVEAAQWCGRGSPADPECDYWLAAALGVQARERPQTALSALPEIEARFRRAAETLPALDDAGPDRALAMLYVRAPGWPTGPGDPDLGLVHARRAVELRPDHPPNHLALAEAYASKGEGDPARQEYGRALDLALALADKGDRDAREWAAEAERGMHKTETE